MIRYTVHARTFGAKKFPQGSPQRAKLNEHVLTSEYMPSYRYIVLDRLRGIGQTFRTKREAQASADRLNEAR